jgi:predicted nuclease of predicted toxin-antitoxin system
VKILLDEMWSPAVARQLRRRGHDVQAVAERPDLRGQPDAVVFTAAQAEMRAIVTENVVDFRPLATQALREGRPHAGVIFTRDRVFPRADRRTIGRLVSALDALLSRELDQENLEFWLS